MTAIDIAPRMKARGYSDEYDQDAFWKLAEWLAAHVDHKARRGLLLYGNPGTGKTLFVSTFLPHVRMNTATRFVDEWKRLGWSREFEELAFGVWRDGRLHVPPKPIAVDDLGQEPVGASYGAKEEVFERILCERYRHWQSYGVRTYLTSNLEIPQIQGRYGKRVVDRLAEMCLWVQFTGKSARSGE